MEILLEIIMIPAVLAIIKIVVIVLFFAMPLGTFLTLMERKWSAMIQDRVGPNRANNRTITIILIMARTAGIIIISSKISIFVFLNYFQ